MDNCYLYVLLDPRKFGQHRYGEYEFDYKPFYIGVGSGSRINSTLNNNCNSKRKANRINEIGRSNVIAIKYKDHISRDVANKLETHMIKEIGRYFENGPLLNEQSGGHSYDPSPYMLENIKIRWKSPIEIEKQSKAQKKRYMDPDERKKQSETMKLIPKITCDHCKKDYYPSHYSQFHGDKCRFKPDNPFPVEIYRPKYGKTCHMRYRGLKGPVRISTKTSVREGAIDFVRNHIQSNFGDSKKTNIRIRGI